MFCGTKIYFKNFYKVSSASKYSFGAWSGPITSGSEVTKLQVTTGLSSDWRNVLCEAEKIVGYPTSFLNLRWLFNDEIANTAINLRKLVGTDHPLIKSAKNLLLGPQSNLQYFGLIILLVAKAAGFDPKLFPINKCDAGILHTQRALAEIVEMKRTGHLVHQTMCNLQDMGNYGEQAKDLLYGNKIVLLSGDYLLASCFHKLGSLRNSEVSELISSGLRDMIEADFIGDRDPENKPIASKPKDDHSLKKNFDWENEDNLKALGSNEYLGQAKDEWTLRTMLSSGSVLGKGCQASVKLAKIDKKIEHIGYILGGHLAISWQLYLDIMDFYVNCNSYSLIGAPVLFAIEEYPQLYDKVASAKNGYASVNFGSLHVSVCGTRAIERTKCFLVEEIETCLKLVQCLRDEEAKAALKKMIVAIHDEAVGYID